VRECPINCDCARHRASLYYRTIFAQLKVGPRLWNSCGRKNKLVESAAAAVETRRAYAAN
jgi:hypothetical protein